MRSTGLKHRMNLLGSVLPDMVANGRGADHDFIGKHTAGAVTTRQKLLRDNALQAIRQLNLDFGLLVRRENIQDTV